MFNNLIESSSHRGEFRRRGSFFLFTTATYALLLVIAGVVSIYAYDARMEDRSLDLVTIMPLVDLPVPAQPPAPQLPNKPISSAHPANNQNYFQREITMAAVDQPTIVPDKISTTANTGLPMPRSGPVKFGPDSDPGDGSSEPGNGGSVSGSSNVVVPLETPPPPAVKTPLPKVIRKTILNGAALSLPKPPYPEMAKQMGIHGPVSVQVLVDETGKVISAKAVSGHPLLAREAQKAAFQARFGLTLLGDQPMKVSGMITYNFVLQQ